jgi:YVTN family beta-propeller protein
MSRTDLFARGLAAFCGLVALVAASAREAPKGATLLPTGQYLTPTAAPGSTFRALNPGLKDFPDFTVGQALSEAISPDRRTLLVMTSGYNYQADPVTGAYLPADSHEYVFVFGLDKGVATQKQVLQVPNTYTGIAFAPDGAHFVVAGGIDDNVHTFTLSGSTWSEAGTPIALGHTKGGLGLAQSPLAAGIAVTADGKRAVVADMYNDSITVVDLAGRSVIADLDLRPGRSGGQQGTPGGEYPYSVQIAGNSTAYVSSMRDREIVVVDLEGSAPSVSARIAVKGNPLKMVLSKSGKRLYVGEDNTDVVSVIDTQSNRVVETIPVVAPAGLLDSVGKWRGASPNGLALSPDEDRLYVTDRGTNAVAVVALKGERHGTVGLIPTGWYPSDVAVGAAGKTLYVINSKSVPGPNPGNCLGYGAPCQPGSPIKQVVQNEYILNLAKAGFLVVPTPSGETLDALTERVAKNNAFDGGDADARDDSVMDALRERIHHVIYIVKENRTYDQILGDLRVGNGDPALAEFPRKTTPSLHALAEQFVTLDNFFDSGEVSGNGWPWSTSARESDHSAKMLPVNYAGRGGSYDWEGTNRNVNVGLTGVARIAADPLLAAPTLFPSGPDPDLFPGVGNPAAPDGPDGEVQQGYLWDAALRHGLSVRNYGFFIDLTRYSSATGPLQIPKDRAPFADGIAQATAANPNLVPLTDVYFRGFDDAYPDFYREQEWEREFEKYVAGGDLPALSLVRLMNDHTGSFSSAIDGVDTPELQIADNDYAVGRLVEALARSPYAKDTLVFIVEDDAQDGPDHVDAHRSVMYVAGPYVKQGALVSRHYTTVNLLRTITDVLGIGHLSLFDAHQPPMTDAFDLHQKDWDFKALASGLLKSTMLPLPHDAQYASELLKPTHLASYWIDRTRELDFDAEDRNDAAAYNRVLWAGLMGRKAYPAQRSGADLRAKRAHLAPVAAKAALGGTTASSD